MNRNETKIGKSHLPTSVVGSHFTSQKKKQTQQPNCPKAQDMSMVGIWVKNVHSPSFGE